MATQTQLIETFYADYLSAFHSLDARAVVSFYMPPCLFVSDKGTVLMLDSAAVESFFSNVMADLKPKNYHHSEVQDLHVETLSGHLALVRGLAVRYTKDGVVLERLRAVYTLRKVAQAWKFITAVAYPANDQLD
jgi:ketosteroid isomerase-like protein